MTHAASSVEGLGVYNNRSTTDNINNDNRCYVQSKRTPLEKRLENACSKFPGHRTANDVSSIASQLMAIPTFEQTPEWKIKSLARNMAAIFVREGNDAALLCSDPSFAYFVVTGSLVPVATTTEQHTPSFLVVSCPDSGVVGHPQLSDEGEVTCPNCSGTGGGLPQLADEGAVLRPNSSSSTISSGGHPQLPDGETRGGLPQVSDERAVSSPNSGSGGHPQWFDENSGAGALRGSTKGRKGHPLLLPGQSLDVYVRGQTNANVHVMEKNKHETTGHGSPRNVDMGTSNHETTGHGNLRNTDMGKNNHEMTGHESPRKVYMGKTNHETTWHESPRKVYMGKTNHETTGNHEPTGHGSPTAEENGSGRLGWRLEAREPACIGRVSHRFLQELELEEPRRDLEHKVAFLRKTEVFAEGFSAPVLERLAMLMERRHQACSRVVVRKGSAADKVIVVESGEAVRVEDHAAESGGKASSLCIASGGMFGAEEAVSRLPTYSTSLMATAPLRFFEIPVAVFLQAVDGVWTAALSRLNSRACLARHRRAEGSGAALPGMFASPMTSVDGSSSSGSECSLRNGRSSGEGARADALLLLPTLRPSLTRQPPVRLTPAPFFSMDAAKGYRRITGATVETDLEDRINNMAAVWTPWLWSDRTTTAPCQRSRSSSSSRPGSAPASTTKRSDLPFRPSPQLHRAASRSPSASKSPSALRSPSASRSPSALRSPSAARSPCASRSPSSSRPPSPLYLQQAQETFTTRRAMICNGKKRAASTAGVVAKHNTSSRTGDRAEVSPEHASTRRGDRVEASPEFRLLGPSACGPLVGCPESMRHLGREHSTAGGSSSCCSSSTSRFRPETLMTRTRAKGGRRQQQQPRKHHNNMHTGIGLEDAAGGGGGGGLHIGLSSKEEKSVAGGGGLHIIPLSNDKKQVAGGGGGFHVSLVSSSEHKNNVVVLEEAVSQQLSVVPLAAKNNGVIVREETTSKLSKLSSAPAAKKSNVLMLEKMTSKFSIPVAAAAAAAADSSSEADVEDDDDTTCADSSFSEGELISSGILCSTSSSLSTQSSSSGTLTHIAETLLMWDRREIAVAERAVSARPQRRRLCRAFRAGESKLAGMTAAQRAYRGAFVMSKMGDARARSKWRP